MIKAIILVLCCFSAHIAESQISNVLQYRNIGPTRGGRVTAVSGVNKYPNTYYMGATGGGVWKTEDNGTTWNNISDGFFATPSIGAISVYQDNPDIIYVGTGTDGLRSNIISGKGIYKSKDAGKTWIHCGLEETRHIGAVEIHPDNPDVVFVAAIGNAFVANEERGIYRTLDGGQNWKRVLYLSDSIGFSDIKFHPANPDILYAGAWQAQRTPWTIISGGTEGGIYKSEDGGSSWNKLEQGLPVGIMGKIDLAVSAAHADKVYALIEAPQGIGGLYSSEMQGDSFQLISTKKELLDRPFYYCNVDADPQNADVVYVNSTRFFKSSNGGKDWKKISTPHGDNHDMWISPIDSMLWVQGNDGGANVTFNGGKSWSSQMNQSTAELYQVDVDDQNPYWLYAGQQDNYTTISVPSSVPYGSQVGGIGFVRNTGGCETGPAVPKPGNPDIVYSNCKGRFGVFNKNTGQEKRYYVGASNMYGHNPKDLQYRFQRVSPIHVSPHDADKIYHCSQYVHVTRNEGETWEIVSPDLTAFTEETQVISGSPITRDITGEEFYSTIYSIRESAISEGLIWVGANDGPVHMTKNGGADWTDVTPQMEGGGRVDCVEPSTHRPEKAYVAILRYQLGDWSPYIFKTNNYGADWKLITNGIPSDHPVRVIREDPQVEGLLYAGTEYGMFISYDDGVTWESFQQNLPVTPVTDIKVHQSDLVLSTMGRGFWIMDNLSPLYQNSAVGKDIILLQPRDQYRLRYRGTAKETIPYYPAASVDIDYYLPEDTKSQIRLDILNPAKKIIRTFFSQVENTAGDIEDSERNMATGFIEEGMTEALKSTKGGHRFHWDMRHAGPWDAEASKAYKSGPLVSPGMYSVRLTSNSKTYEQTFTIKADQTVLDHGVSLADMIAQEELALNTISLINQAKRHLHKQEQSLKKLKDSEITDKESQAKVEDIIAKLKTPEGRYQKPALIAQMSYLFSMLKQADQKPGQDAYERFESLYDQYHAIIQ